MPAYPYHLYYPEAYGADPDKKWPLLLFLHGAGEKGENLEKVKRQGLPKLLEQWKNFPFVVAYPQCPVRSYWQVPLLESWLQAVLAEVQQADLDRIYLTGISMGGYGTWHWATARPQDFAAILPICGGGDTSKAYRLQHLAIWAFHGAKDDIVGVDETLDMVDAVRAAGGHVELTVYPNLNHDSWSETYNNPRIYDWLLQHRRHISFHSPT